MIGKEPVAQQQLVTQIISTSRQVLQDFSYYPLPKIPKKRRSERPRNLSRPSGESSVTVPVDAIPVPVDAIFPVSVESVPESSTLNKKGKKTLTSFSSVLSKQPVEIS